MWEKGSGSGVEGERASEEGKGPREKRKKAVGKVWPPAGREGWLRGRLPGERSWDSTVLDSRVPGNLSVPEPVRRSSSLEWGGLSS